MKNKWVIDDVVDAGAIWHRALEGDRGEVTAFVLLGMAEDPLHRPDQAKDDFQD